MDIASKDAVDNTGLEHSFLLNQDSEAPLILMVHGKAGTHRVMSIFNRSLPKNCNVLLPQANLADPIGGYSWWLENTEEEFLKGAKELENFYLNSLEYYKLKPKYVIAIGFSQGGAVLSVLSQLKPNYFKSICMLASFYIDIKGLETTRYPDFFIAHGTSDEVIPFLRAEKGYNYLKSQGVDVYFTYEDIGHKVGSKSLKELKEFLDKK